MQKADLEFRTAFCMERVLVGSNLMLSHLPPNKLNSI